MDQQVASPGADGVPAQAPVSVVTTSPTDSYNSVSQAARALAQARHKPKDQTQAGEQRPEATPQEPEQESTAQAGEAAPPDTEVRGQAEVADPAEVPPIEPPRSWTKEDKELFASLPPETQQRVADRERSRESDFLRRQNDAADKLKGLTAKEQAVEQARQQYESALPILLSNLQAAMQGEFSDIKTMADVQRMAKEDWPRYVQWDAAQKQVADVAQKMRVTQERQAAEQAQRWSEFAKRQDDLLAEKVPELADRTKAARMQDAALVLLKDIGFTEDELGQAWSGRSGLSLRDHRVQLLVLDGIRYRDAQQKARQAAAKSSPPVQRPGVSQPRGAAREAELQNLNKTIDNTKGVSQLRAAARLIAERRRA